MEGNTFPQKGTLVGTALPPDQVSSLGVRKETSIAYNDACENCAHKTSSQKDQQQHSGNKDCAKCLSYRHKQTNHEVIQGHQQSFPCSECEKSFTLKSNLLRHKKIHSVETPFSCSDCEKRFRVEDELSKHKMMIHGVSKPYFSCSDCDKCFTTEIYLLKHKQTHDFGKTYPCNDCGKMFKHKSLFLAHQRIHTGEKAFECSECGKRFIHRSSLAAHFKKSHFYCKVCGKCFDYEHNLMLHGRVHSAGQPSSFKNGHFSQKSDSPILQNVHMSKDSNFHLGENDSQWKRNENTTNFVSVVGIGAKEAEKEFTLKKEIDTHENQFVSFDGDHSHHFGLQIKKEEAP